MQSVVREDLPLLCVRDIHSFYGIDGLPIASKAEIVIPEWHIGSKHYMVCAEEMIGQHQRRGIAVNGRIGIKHLVVLNGRFRQLFWKKR